jgi:transcriptional repressor NrdR
MKCPFCGTPDTRVVDSRLAADSNQVRRRRECVSCEARFTTYESPMLNMPMVIKNDGSRDAFDEQRVRNGMLRALEKRPVSAEDIEDAMSHIKRQLAALDAREVKSRQIGDMVMRELQKLDHVAYIRFASVYLSFEDIASFREVIRRLEAEPTPEMQRRQVPLIDEGED